MIQTSLTLTTSSSKYGTSSLKIPSGNEIWQWQYSTATFDYRRSYILFEINYRLLYNIYIYIYRLVTHHYTPSFTFCSIARFFIDRTTIGLLAVAVSG